MTYKTMADRFKVHPRKISMTMKHNLEPEVYPCYKIIAHSGKLGGYSGPNGTHGKVQRLKVDGIELVNGKVPAEYII
jgi:O6-methylguanine-DNA--protein-cysteine methyltransferase